MVTLLLVLKIINGITYIKEIVAKKVSNVVCKVIGYRFTFGINNLLV